MIEDGVLTIFDQDRQVLAQAARTGNMMYKLNLSITSLVCLLSKGGDPVWAWLERYGNLNFRALKSLSKEKLVRGMPEITHPEQFCQ